MTKKQFVFFILSSFFSCSIFLISCAKKSIDIEYNGHICIKTKINDTFFGNFIYDTGAPEFILDTSFCKKNNLIFNNKQNTEISGIGNINQKVEVIYDTLIYKIDKKTNLSNKTYLVALKNILGQNIDGVLGIKTFEDRIHKIDYINKKISFPKNYINFDSIKITYDGDKVLVPINYTIKQKEYSGKFILDLGSSVTILNSTNKIDADYGGSYEAIGGIGGKTTGKTIFINQFKFGKHSILAFPIDIADDNKGALSSSKYNGILGNDILDDFDIVIDLKLSNLYIRPNKKNNKHKKFFYKSFSFIDRTNIDHSWLVSYIYLNTDAYKQGLRLNDKIIAIDGVSVEQLNTIIFYKRLELNQRLELTIIRNKKQIKINFILNKFLDGE